MRRISWQEQYRKSGRLKLAAEVAADLLRETGNPGVGYGDAGLLHQIAERLGMPHEGRYTERKVLNRIEASYTGVLEKRLISYPERGLARVRRYWLPEAAPRTTDILPKEGAFLSAEET